MVDRLGLAPVVRDGGAFPQPDDVAKAVTGVDAVFLMAVGSGTEQARTMIGAARDAADVENLTGIAPGSFRAWCARNAGALR